MKKLFRIFFLLSFLSLFLLCQNCKKDENNPTAPPEDNVVLRENTKVLSADSESKLIDPGLKQDTLFFNGEIGDIKVNDIIISKVGPGILRKIKTIQKIGNQTVLTTDSVSLINAFSNFKFSSAFNINNNNISKIDYEVDGITLLKSGQVNDLAFSVNDVVLWDRDGNPFTTGDQITASGSFTLQLNPFIDWDLQDDFKWVKLTFEPTGIMELNFHCPLEIDFLKPDPIKIFTIHTTPQVITVGFIPVVITNEIPIYLGFEGSAKAELTTGIKNTTSLKLGFEYTNGNINWIHSNTNNFEYTPPTLNAELSLKAYLEPQINMKLYGVAGPSINFNLFGEGVGELAFNPISGQTDLKGTLYGGVQAKVGAILKIFDFNITSIWSPLLIDFKFKIYEWFNTITTSNPPTVTISPISIITSNSAISGGNVTVDGGSAVITRGVCWSTNHNPTTSDNKTIDGSGLGAFVSNLSGLSHSTKYYVRAYATNNAGTSYSSEETFTTTSSGATVGLTGEALKNYLIGKWAKKLEYWNAGAGWATFYDGQFNIEFIQFNNDGTLISKYYLSHWIDYSTNIIYHSSGYNLIEESGLWYIDGDQLVLTDSQGQTKSFNVYRVFTEHIAFLPPGNGQIAYLKVN